MLPPSWRKWPQKVVITGVDEEYSWWGGEFKGFAVVHYDLLELLPSSSLGP